MPRGTAPVVGRIIPRVLGVVLSLAPGLAGAQAPTDGAVESAPPAVKLTVMSPELLEGIPTGRDARLLHVQGDVRAPECGDVYAGLFRIDSGASESIAPASELERIGIVPVGIAAYELPDGTVHEYPFGLARIEFMGEMREGRVLFGPEDVEPVLGLSALESIGLTIDAWTETLKRLDP